MTGKLKMTKGSGNVFADLGFSAEESANLQMRADLINAIEDWFKASGLTQSAAATKLGINQPRFNMLLKGKLNEFSLDALVNMAVRTGLHVELGIRKAA